MGEPGLSLEEILTTRRFEYEEAWKKNAYRRLTTSEKALNIFMDTVKPPRAATLIDWGCGTGRAGLRAWKQALDVTLVDFAENCLDDDVRDSLSESLTFIRHDIQKPIDLRSDYGLCVDTIEHIEEEDLGQALENILSASNEVFFHIFTGEDDFGFGKFRKTLRPYTWWLQRFANLGLLVLHSQEFADSCLFHVSGFRTFWWTRGGVNNEEEVIHEQLRENAKWSVQQLEPQGKGEGTLRPGEESPPVLFLAGGPSLNDFTDEIREKRAQGYPLITVNNTFNWALDHGLTPSLQFMIDSRAFNKRFVERHAEAESCKFAIASQCHPSVFEMLPKDRTYMWHVSLEDSDLEVLNDTYGPMYEGWWPVPGGCAVTLRALCALQMIGFRRVELYGFDSCLADDTHHAYEQPENDGDDIIEVRIAKGTEHDRSFKCYPFMARQMKEFDVLVNSYLKDMDLIVHGDGLIAHMVKTSAAYSAQE
jgi:hypothetical protein